MSEKNYQVVALLRIKPESKEWALENVFKKQVEETRKEPGCISYTLHYDVKEPNTLVMLEIFKSREDFFVHMKAPHIAETVSKLKDHMSKPPEIRIIQPLL